MKQQRTGTIIPFATLLAAALGAKAAQTEFIYSPYIDVTQSNTSTSDPVIETDAKGGTTPVVSDGALPKGVALTWAFAVGECGAESWENQLSAAAIAKANVAAFAHAGIRYIVSTGGQGGTFTCGSDAGMDTFINRYNSASLIGIDFDIENSQSQSIIENLVLRTKNAEAKYPNLRFSFTLPTVAASDGSLDSLDSGGEMVLAAIKKYGLQHYYINLMVMDYGSATKSNCVVVSKKCEMGQSAIQAAENVAAKYGVSLDKIELTPDIGVNDVKANVFTLADATTMAKYVKQNGLGGVHFWSLDRDTPCSKSTSQNNCSSLPSVPALGFTNGFNNALK
jgi:hypothetical protein